MAKTPHFLIKHLARRLESVSCLPISEFQFSSGSVAYTTAESVSNFYDKRQETAGYFAILVLSDLEKSPTNDIFLETIFLCACFQTHGEHDNAPKERGDVEK